MKKYIVPSGILIGTLLISIVINYNSSSKVIPKKSAYFFKKKENLSRYAGVPILLYHNIDGKGVFSITSKTLRRHFKMIKDSNINVISLKELIDRLDNPKPFRKKTIVITFDDGYLSMYTKLLPLAREFNYPITLFIYSDFISTSSKRALTWEKLRSMDKLIDIQSHSISHPDLTKFSKRDNYSSNKKLFDEIYLAKRVIELYMRKGIDRYAFPYGRYDLNIVEMCEGAGYSSVFSTNYGSNIITRNNYCLRRHHIKNSYSDEFIMKLIQ